MIKTKTIKVEVVLCDICGADTNYDGTSGYAKQKKHFCQKHKDLDKLWFDLREYPKTQEALLSEALSGKTPYVEEKQYSSTLHPSITHVGQ